MPGLRFCFASELKALTILPGFRAEVGPCLAVSDFLALSYIPDPETICRCVSRLEPGQSIRATRSGVQLRRYWEPQFEPEPQRDFDASIEEIRGLAKDAVERRLMSDVPLGAFLSGGVDSSAVVGLMASSAPDRVKTFRLALPTSSSMNYGSPEWQWNGIRPNITSRSSPLLSKKPSKL